MAGPTHIAPDEVAGWVRGIEAKHKAALLQATRLAAYDGQREAIRRIDSTPQDVGLPAPSDTGLLRSSYVVLPVERGADLLNTAPHAPVMEFGARPFTPPMEPLRAWAARKLRGSTKMAKAGRTALRRPRDGKRVKRAVLVERLARRAWVAMRARGIAGRRFHTRASGEFDKHISKRALAALRSVDGS